MYRNNIYTKPGLIGFGNYQGLGVLKLANIAPTKTVNPYAVEQPKGVDSLPTWVFIAAPIGLAAIAAVIYYRFA